MARTVLVTGATGKQGGAVINSLLAAKADLEILAVTRDATSSAAQKLAQKSPTIKLITGDLNNAEDIFRKAKEVSPSPIWGVYSVQVVAMKNGDDTEERQGKALVDAAVKNSVKHFVYSSVDRGGEKSAQNPTDVPHFIHKHNVEQHLFRKAKESGMTYAILRPVAFFENLVPGFAGKIFGTVFEMKMKKRPLQFIATSDIGYFGAQAFLKPEEWRNRSISLAGDELTVAQFKDIFKQKTGQTLPSTFRLVGHLILWLSKDFNMMFNWFESHGYNVNIEELKKQRPELQDLGTWLEKESQFETR